MFKVYLAGGLSNDWQDAIKDQLKDVKFLDPRSWQDPDPKVYTDRDLEAIRKSDAIFAFMSSSNPSGYGMSLEIGYAFALQKPIVFCNLPKDDWRQRYFGMAQTCATYVCESVQEAAGALIAVQRELS